MSLEFKIYYNLHHYHPKYLPIDDGRTLPSRHISFPNAKTQNRVKKVSSQSNESEMCSKTFYDKSL